MASIETNNRSVENLQSLISSFNPRVASPECWRCFGTGTRFIELPNGGRATKLCICRKRAGARKLLEKVPPIFGKPKLSRLKPRLDLHPSQARIIEHVQKHPLDSYLLTGRNGTGKSHIAWAMYRNAIAQGRGIVFCVVRDLLAEFRRVEMDAEARARINAETLRAQANHWTLFLDEFDKARPSEFASEQLFNLLDAAKSFQHQLVVTSNFSVEQLRAHWGRIDQVWGNSILNRLQDCHVVEMF